MRLFEHVFDFLLLIMDSIDKYQESHSRVYVQMFTDIFMMRNKMLNAGVDYKSGLLFLYHTRELSLIVCLPEDLQLSMLDSTLVAQIKKFSLHLAVTLSRSEVRILLF